MKNALVVDAQGNTLVLDVEFDFLSKMQNAVDGLIEPIDLSNDLTMWVNEEFLFRDSFEPNLLGTAMYQNLGATGIIMGTIVFTGGTDSEGETLGLSDSEIEKITQIANVARHLTAVSV